MSMTHTNLEKYPNLSQAHRQAVFKQSGFTLIEIMVVVIIIGVLSTLIFAKCAWTTRQGFRN